MRPDELIAFEEEIAESFNNAQIRAPIHLYSGNEKHIINIFKNVKKEDYVFCTWRSHYQCLLKGVPKDRLKKDILAGKSITLCYPEYNIFSSAIVTGILPIAVGLGLSIKRDKKDNWVYCFVGDMTSETGSFNECYKYVQNYDLPVKFIIEDNNKSVCTDTKQTWNTDRSSYERANNKHLYYYKYETKWPHAGAGERVQF